MPSFSSLVFAVALAVSSPFAFAESNSNLRPETDSGGFIHPAESLNIFGLPKGVKVAADAAEGGRKLQTIATGWLYASSNGGNTDCSTVNTVVGTLTNTCLVSGLDTTNNDQNSILYTCDSGMFKCLCYNIFSSFNIFLSYTICRAWIQACLFWYYL